MNGRFDSSSLERALRAAGLAHINDGGPYVGCRSGTRSDQDGTDDVAQIIDWVSGHPTPAERIIAQAVLAAHDPMKRKREQAVRRDRIAAIEQRIKAGTEAAPEIREHRRLEIEFRENGGGL